MWCNRCAQDIRPGIRTRAEREFEHDCRPPALATLLDHRFNLDQLQEALDQDRQRYPKGLTLEIDSGPNNYSIECPMPEQARKDQRILELQEAIREVDRGHQATRKELRRRLQELLKTDPKDIPPERE